MINSTMLSVAEATDNGNEISDFVINKPYEYGCHHPIYIARISVAISLLKKFYRFED